MLPRQVLPRQFYLVTRRCAQRQFLLRPDAATNNAFLYCLIVAAPVTQIQIELGMPRICRPARAHRSAQVCQDRQLVQDARVGRAPILRSSASSV